MRIYKSQSEKAKETNQNNLKKWNPTYKYPTLLLQKLFFSKTKSWKTSNKRNVKQKAQNRLNAFQKKKWFGSSLTCIFTQRIFFWTIRQVLVGVIVFLSLQRAYVCLYSVQYFFSCLNMVTVGSSECCTKNQTWVLLSI